MKKLTNTQVKELTKVKSYSKKYVFDSGDELLYTEYEWIGQATQLDMITSIAEQVLFIDNDYCPQYLIVANYVAWLSVCTDIPLVMKKIKYNNSIIEVIDFETNYNIAQTLIHANGIPLCLDVIAHIIKEYVDDRLIVNHNRLKTKLETLTSNCERSVSIIMNISNELEKIYKDTDIMTGLQDVANEMNGLNKRLDSNASDKIINMLASKDSDQYGRI